MKQLLKNLGGAFLQIQTDILVYTDPLLQIIIIILLVKRILWTDKPTGKVSSYISKLVIYSRKLRHWSSI